MTATVSTDEWLELGSSTIYEASGLPCSLDPRIQRVWPGAVVSGPAYPVQCAPADNLALHRAVELAPAGSVLVANAGGLLVGYWGEVLTWAARAQGIAGLVIDGGVRDVDRLEAMRFPVFARGVAMTGTDKAETGSVGRAIKMGDVVVAPGDLVVADRDGTMCLPIDSVEQVLAAARARQAKECGLIEQIRNGARTLDLYGWRSLTEADDSVAMSPAADVRQSGGPG